MATICKGITKDGVIELETPVSYPNRTTVAVQVKLMQAEPMQVEPAAQELPSPTEEAIRKFTALIGKAACHSAVAVTRNTLQATHHK